MFTGFLKALRDSPDRHNFSCYRGVITASLIVQQEVRTVHLLAAMNARLERQRIMPTRSSLMFLAAERLRREF